ncbi:MAG: FHA domain-containing protein [Gemmatimonadales bacterium]|nr:MAG: FHA domain-containing protein [Gemmatimonadales bacterium]
MDNGILGGPAGVLLLAVGIGAVVLGAWLWFRSRRTSRSEPPMLVFPTHRASRARGVQAFDAHVSGGPASTSNGTAATSPGPDGSNAARRDNPIPPPRPTPPATAAPAGRGASDPGSRMVISTAPAPPGLHAPGRLSTGGGAQQQRPPDGTLQLLPGRFEVTGGPGAGEEIRFVRLPGLPAEITFGRGDGPEYRHVRLESPTVSRQQARISFNGGNWSLRNESSTNPTSVNGSPLASDIEEVPLSDGDRIEMGEISFTFHHKETRDRLPFRSSWHTDLGRRPTNQDAVIVKSLPDGRELAAVCDGMGSHQAGGEASHLALEALVAALSLGAGLVDAVKQANTRVMDAARLGSTRDGIGTTLVALLRHGATYQIANVGDSRAYRIAAGGVRQLTEDHSFVAEATREGRMSHEEASRSPWRNAVTRNLGASDHVEVDLFAGFDATENHLIILCTDGVHGVLAEDEIAEVCRQTPDVRDLARALSEQALIRGGEDNVAVAAVSFGSLRAATSPTTAE